VAPSLPLDPRTACVHNWRTLACAGGFYLDHMKPKPCPPGKPIHDIINSEIPKIYAVRYLPYPHYSSKGIYHIITLMYM
jgi:hypothetical protein